MNLNFEEMFESTVLNSGRRYYNNGSVQFVYKDKNQYEATVYERSIHEVKINIDEKENIKNMSCTCRSAKNNNCKHMAALLYYLKNANIVVEKNSIQTAKSECKKRIKNIIFEVCGNGFLDEDESWKFSHSMYDLIHEMQELVEDNKYQVPFWITTQIIEELPDAPVDDSFGVLGDIADWCGDVIKNILEKCNDENIIKEIFEWIVLSLNDTNIEVYMDKIEDFFYDYFQDECYLNIKLEMLDKKIKELDRPILNSYLQQKKSKLLEKKEDILVKINK